ncbi:MAG: hemerythrin family protein [Eubacteriales bacterium]
MAFVLCADMLTGNEIIDKEHVELFAKINDFMESCAKGKGRDDMEKTVEFLRSYTKTHFSNEETLQKINKYPNYTVHKAFHDQFIGNMEAIVTEIKTSGVSVGLVGKINMQLGSALIAHIKTEDVKLAKFLKDL